MSFLTTLLADPVVRTALTRAGMVLVAWFVHKGWIPTGVEGGGDPVAAVIATTAAAFTPGMLTRIKLAKKP